MQESEYLSEYTKYIASDSDEYWTSLEDYALNEMHKDNSNVFYPDIESEEFFDRYFDDQLLTKEYRDFSNYHLMAYMDQGFLDDASRLFGDYNFLINQPDFLFESSQPEEQNTNNQAETPDQGAIYCSVDYIEYPSNCVYIPTAEEQDEASSYSGEGVFLFGGRIDELIDKNAVLEITVTKLTEELSIARRELKTHRSRSRKNHQTSLEL